MDGFRSEEINCIQHGSPKMFNCWLVEFSLKVDTTTKLVNGLSFDQAMTEGNDFQSKIKFSLKQQLLGNDY